MTTDDWKALVAELVSIDDAMQSGTQHVSNQGQALDRFSALAHFRNLAKRARSVLTQKEAEELIYRAWDALDESKQSYRRPSKSELEKLLYYKYSTSTGHGTREDPIGFAFEVLDRWGNHSVVAPISVRDRLPQVTDLDDKGCCWFGNKLSFTNKWEWFYGDAVIYMRSGCTHWLPASTKVLPTIYE